MIQSPTQETALASELLEIASENEIDRLLPKLMKPALRGLPSIAAVVARAAAPVLKKAASKAIPAIRSASVQKRRGVAGAPRRPGDPLGFDSGVSTRSARLWGTNFQRSRPREIQMAMSRRFVQAARQAARQAALATIRHVQKGGTVTFDSVRRVVYRALVGAIREGAPFLLPTMRSVAASLRQGPSVTGPMLPAIRPGRIQGVPARSATRSRPGYTGPGLPRVRTNILGARGSSTCPTCKHQRVSARA